MIGITESNIGGRIRRMNFSSNAWYLFCKMHALALEDASKVLFDTKTPEALRDMVYCALVVSDRAEGKEVDYNEYTVGEWIDKISQEELTRYVNVLFEGSAKPEATKKKVKSK